MTTPVGPELGAGRFVLDLGPESIAGQLPAGVGPVALEAAYASFLGGGGGASAPLAELSFYAGEEEVAGWNEAREVFRSGVWSLRDGHAGRFVVGTAFGPPQPFWVARAGQVGGEVPVAHLAASPPVPAGLVVEAALRILSRLFLMSHLSRGGSGMVVHTAAVSVGGRSYLLLGRSGAGKSTLSRLLLEQAGCEVVNDDRMILSRDRAARWTAWGTPWPGELRIAQNHHAPVGALVFLEKSAVTGLEPLAPPGALERLLPLVSVPWYDPGLVPPALDLCGQLVAEVPVLVLRFRPDESAAVAVLQLAGR